jgi:hypothetical protein
MVAFFLFIPVFTNTLVANSIIEIKELKAANVNPKKNRIEKMPPPLMVANNLGIQMKVKPVEAGPEVFITSRISALDIVAPSVPNTVEKMIIAETMETILFPIPV